MEDGQFHRPAKVTYPEGPRFGSLMVGLLFSCHIPEILSHFCNTVSTRKCAFSFASILACDLGGPDYHMTSAAVIYIIRAAFGRDETSDQVNGWAFYNISWLYYFLS